MEAYQLTDNESFELESGCVLPFLTFRYRLLGPLDENRKIIWIFTSSLQDLDLERWAKEWLGVGKAINPHEFTLICVGPLGASLGSSGPLTDNPETHTPYFGEFPICTIRDQVKAFERLASYLKISKIWLAIGAEMGGMQIFEWMVRDPFFIEKAFIASATPYQTAAGRAFNETQRLCLESDKSFSEEDSRAGKKGLRAAVSQALLRYRNLHEQDFSFHEPTLVLFEDPKEIKKFRQHAEGAALKLQAHSHYLLTKAMDTHHVGRGRGGLRYALGRIRTQVYLHIHESDACIPLDALQEAATLIQNIQMELHPTGTPCSIYPFSSVKMNELLTQLLKSKDNSTYLCARTQSAWHLYHSSMYMN